MATNPSDEAERAANDVSAGYIPPFDPNDLTAMKAKLDKSYSTSVGLEAFCLLLARDFNSRTSVHARVELQDRVKEFGIPQKLISGWLLFAAYDYNRRTLPQQNRPPERHYHQFTTTKGVDVFSELLNLDRQANPTTYNQPDTTSNPSAGVLPNPPHTIDNPVSWWARRIVFVAFILPAMGLVGMTVQPYFSQSSNRPAQAGNGNGISQLGSPAAPPKLTNLQFKVREHENQEPPLTWELLSPNVSIDHIIRPGNDQTKDKDCLQLVGMFDRPVLWHILWQDSAGKWFRVQSSDGEKAAVLWPVPSPGKEVAFVWDTDPPGVHVVFLISGSITANTIDALLAQPTSPGRPPDALTQWTGAVRGPGIGPGSEIPSAIAYLTALEKWLPPEVTTARFFALKVGKR
jgi:hypothetical protein